LGKNVSSLIGFQTRNRIERKQRGYGTIGGNIGADRGRGRQLVSTGEKKLSRPTKGGGLVDLVRLWRMIGAVWK